MLNKLRIEEKYCNIIQAQYNKKNPYIQWGLFINEYKVSVWGGTRVWGIDKWLFKNINILNATELYSFK